MFQTLKSQFVTGVTTCKKESFCVLSRNWTSPSSGQVLKHY